ncbi:hypothetical protein RHMOL_Rhmol03G0179300 [Rhododendron molle]|uniref:Uncharacterized protein n=1 Tax=Rhododendron molle TaxID=49168 RepID=A0ACC0PFH5_RHOML|nr:hypothetical protein RHMOL_Rhmol03G0179300 [Rhododendron molle]
MLLHRCSHRHRCMAVSSTQKRLLPPLCRRSNFNTNKALFKHMKYHRTANILCSDRTCVRKFGSYCTHFFRKLILGTFVLWSVFI